MKKLLLLAALWASSATADSLKVEDAWVRLSPPGAKVTAAFMTLRNPSTRPVVVSKASSPVFGLIELHRTQMSGGVMKMVKENQLTVEAKGQLVLKPKSWHLMLFSAKKTLAAGDKVAIDLHFADGTRQTIEAAVRRMAHQHAM